MCIPGHENRCYTFPPHICHPTPALLTLGGRSTARLPSSRTANFFFSRSSRRRSSILARMAASLQRGTGGLHSFALPFRQGARQMNGRTALATGCSHSISGLTALVAPAPPAAAAPPQAAAAAPPPLCMGKSHMAVYASGKPAESSCRKACTQAMAGISQQVVRQHAPSPLLLCCPRRCTLLFDDQPLLLSTGSNLCVQLGLQWGSRQVESAGVRQ